MLDAIEKRIIACCNALMDDTLELTCDLVRGYNVLGQEHGALETMERHLERLGLPVTRVPLDVPGFAEHPHRAPTEWSNTGRYNVVSDLNPDTQGPNLVFNGHLDVVPAEPTDMWTRPPWEPWQKDGWLYGRGAGDMKAGIASPWSWRSRPCVRWASKSNSHSPCKPSSRKNALATAPWPACIRVTAVISC